MFRIHLTDADDNSLAVEQGPDAAQVFTVEWEIAELVNFILTHRSGFYTDADGIEHAAPVAAFQVFEDKWDITEEVKGLRGLEEFRPAPTTTVTF